MTARPDALIARPEPDMAARSAWKVLIIDDEPEVHEVTELVLGDFEFEGRPLVFLHAHSAKQARSILADEDDIAVVLLDVVMESEQAGLELVHYIRRELDNPFVRIVLRTGQPGQAPEREVVANYDINDYKEKTELTSERLFTTLYSTLRAYRDVMIIEANKRGLERVIECSAEVFSHQTSPAFASAVLEQIVGLLGVDRGALYCKGAEHPTPPEQFVVRAATGPYRDLVDSVVSQALPGHVVESLKSAWQARQSVILEDHYVLHFTDSRQSQSLLYVGETYRLSDLDYKLLEVFCTNVSIAFENLLLNQELSESQSEMLCLLAGVAETRSMETANHVRRVGELAAILARACGLDAQQVEMMRLAAPLHDIGKIGIPDAVLNKPGRHTEEETRIMRGHVEIGVEMLSVSSRPLFQMATEIARDHHENWDGSGYPRGIEGEEISLAGRIVALSDVCDALGSKRCYKPPWSDEKVRQHLLDERGRKFDPQLIDLLMDHWEEVGKLRERMPD
jgi:putative nucleotidyltransferase with HDIG domain